MWDLKWASHGKKWQVFQTSLIEKLQKPSARNCRFLNRGCAIRQEAVLQSLRSNMHIFSIVCYAYARQRNIFIRMHRMHFISTCFWCQTGQTILSSRPMFLVPMFGSLWSFLDRFWIFHMFHRLCFRTGWSCEHQLVPERASLGCYKTAKRMARRTGKENVRYSPSYLVISSK